MKGITGTMNVQTLITIYDNSTYLPLNGVH